MKEERFEKVVDIQKNVTTALNAMSEEEFPSSFYEGTKIIRERVCWKQKQNFFQTLLFVRKKIIQELLNSVYGTGTRACCQKSDFSPSDELHIHKKIEFNHRCQNYLT